MSQERDLAKKKLERARSTQIFAYILSCHNLIHESRIQKICVVRHHETCVLTIFTVKVSNLQFEKMFTTFDDINFKNLILL